MKIKYNICAKRINPCLEDGRGSKVKYQGLRYRYELGNMWQGGKDFSIFGGTAAFYIVTGKFGIYTYCDK